MQHDRTNRWLAATGFHIRVPFVVNLGGLYTFRYCYMQHE